MENIFIIRVLIKGNLFIKLKYRIMKKYMYLLPVFIVNLIIKKDGLILKINKK
jgi:hypothetical protein